MSEKRPYDIFISYRRHGGAEYARPLKSELEQRGYNVFLDYDELKDGVFDKRIMDAIEQAPIFVFMLSAHSLDRCVNDDDWVRKEIEFAVSKNRHIVPVNPNKEFDGFPDNIPEQVKQSLGQHQFSHIDFEQLFKVSVREMIEHRIQPILSQITTERNQSNRGALIRIETDLDCNILRFGKQIGTALCGEVAEIRLPKGKHKLSFVGMECDSDRYDQLLTVEDLEYEDYLNIRLRDKYLARKAQEHELNKRAEKTAAIFEEVERKEAERKAREEEKRQRREDAARKSQERRENLKAILKRGRIWFVLFIFVVVTAVCVILNNHSSGYVDTFNDFGDIEMVFVEGGTFTMGATSEQGSDAGSDERPAKSVTLSDYYIGKYEVTQAQWRAVMGSNPSYFKGDNLPVENVSWNDIQMFVRKLNAKTGKNFRLPTEAEWEYAARGGNQSKGYKYSGSDTLGDVAWYDDNSNEKTHPVGEKRPNELGIYDMSGNVLEWCGDWYDRYSSSSQTNPTGPSSGSSRVLRGGCWGNFRTRHCRVSNRFDNSPDSCDYGSGFRLVCSPDLNTPMSTAVASTTKTYKVGDYYNENGKQGVVFEVSADGRHGKIVSMKQSTEGLQWATTERKFGLFKSEAGRLIGADSETDGAYNMAKVKAISGWETKYPAFKWCADLGEGWYLPSKEELKTFTLNDVVHDAVNRTLSARGCARLYNGGVLDRYWSSTEDDYKYSSDEVSAWVLVMGEGVFGRFGKKNASYVRAVAVF